MLILRSSAPDLCASSTAQFVEYMIRITGLGGFSLYLKIIRLADMFGWTIRERHQFVEISVAAAY